jgi:hypothetical protein
MREWEVLKQRNPQARLVCIDIQPYSTTQAAERRDIMNVGGFSDAVFSMMKLFVEGKTNAEHWVGEIETVSLVQQEGGNEVGRCRRRMPTGVQHHQAARARKPATENPSGRSCESRCLRHRPPKIECRRVANAGGTTSLNVSVSPIVCRRAGTL